MADTPATGATAPVSVPYTRFSRWETRQAVRAGQAADIKIYPEGARDSAGAIATVHVRCGREAGAAAYAALIASAPELLDLLQCMSDLVVVAIPHDGSAGAQLRDVFQADIDDARALLARLQGGAL